MRSLLADPDLVSLPEAAQLIGCSVDAVYDRAKDGTLPGLIKIGRPRVSLPRLVAALHGTVGYEERLAEMRARLAELRGQQVAS